MGHFTRNITLNVSKSDLMILSEALDDAQRDAEQVIADTNDNSGSWENYLLKIDGIRKHVLAPALELILD